MLKLDFYALRVLEGTLDVKEGEESLKKVKPSLDVNVRVGGEIVIKEFVEEEIKSLKLRTS